MTTETATKYGREFQRTADGGWLEVGAKLPKGSTAKIRDDALVFAEAAKRMHGGEFHGGEFRGGVFRGGEFHGGEFWGGDFRGGVFHGGEFRGGVFRDGVFQDGEFRGGEFRDGVFWGGEFRDGVFLSSPAMAQRSDGYCFVAHFVGDELRIWAGCRNFSWDEAVEHWSDDHKHGAESQRIIHFLKAQAEANKDLHQ